MGELYKITFPSGKSYIGITRKTASIRLNDHARSRLSRKFAVSRALKKYGKDSVSIEVLAQSDEWKELCAMEREAIVKHDTRYPKGYNLTSGGDGVYDRSDHKMAVLLKANRCPEKKAKIARATKDRWSDPDYRQRHTESNRAAWMDDGRRARMSDRMRSQHAELGTSEKFSKKYKGEGNPSAKLTARDVIEIRRLLRDGRRQVDVAAIFSVHKSTISLIWAGKKWGWLKEPEILAD